MDEEPWRLLVWACAVNADRCCDRADRQLTYAVTLLASPMHVADVYSGRAQDVLVSDLLTQASLDLADAAKSMAAAEILTLRGGAVNPATPLPSIDDLPNGERSLWNALGLLRCAKVCAEDACYSVARCCGRLGTARHLLRYQGLPGLYGIVDAERIAARGYLVTAQNLTASSSDLASTAAPMILQAVSNGSVGLLIDR